MPQATDTHWLMTPNRDKALMLALHIPAHHEHPFRTNVNTDSGST